MSSQDEEIVVDGTTIPLQMKYLEGEPPLVRYHAAPRNPVADVQGKRIRTGAGRGPTAKDARNDLERGIRRQLK